MLALADGTCIAIADTRKGKDAEGRPTSDIVHVPAPGQEAALARLPPGTLVEARIDWERRHRLMRLHTTSHLLCHLVPQLGPVHTIFTSANGVKAAPIEARDDAKAGALARSATTSGAVFAPFPSGCDQKGPSTSLPSLAGAAPQLRLAPSAWPFLIATHLAKTV